jgi:hypothetical protein
MKNKNPQISQFIASQCHYNREKQHTSLSAALTSQTLTTIFSKPTPALETWASAVLKEVGETNSNDATAIANDKPTI